MLRLKSIGNKKGLLVLTVSLLNLPTSEKLREKFGYVKNQYEKIISAKCSFAYDFCNELVINAMIDKKKSCEKDLAFEHLQSLNAEFDILVFDRGYPAQWLIGVLIIQQFKFCVRLSTAWKKAYSDLEKYGNDIDWDIKYNSSEGLEKLNFIILDGALKKRINHLKKACILNILL